jgi:hypothetical protein|tara:strand:+ start:240 stop:467 length:228 start_codon:yes stop_codon:yes gene_type:complete
MNDFTVFIFLIFFVGVFGATFAFMWKMMTTTIDSLNKPIKRQNIHPEMTDVKSGEELLVFNVEDDDDDDVIIIRR